MRHTIEVEVRDPGPHSNGSRKPLHAAIDQAAQWVKRQAESVVRDSHHRWKIIRDLHVDVSDGDGDLYRVFCVLSDDPQDWSAAKSRQ